MAANTIAWGGKLVSPVQAYTETRAPIHRGEKLLTPGYTADVELKIPATIEGPKRTQKSWGRVWLTDQRVSPVAQVHCLAEADSSSSSSRSSGRAGRT